MTDPDTIATYEAVAETYRDRHDDRELVRPLAEQFLDALPATDGPDRILDVGCGPAWEARTFAEHGYDVLGVDLARSFLEVASEVAPAADLARMDMRHLGVADDAFDGVWALASFLHVPRPDAPATLAGFHRVLRDGGVLYLSVKHGEGRMETDAYDEDRRTFVLWEREELAELVREAGFAVEEASVNEPTVEDAQDWLTVLARK